MLAKAPFSPVSFGAFYVGSCFISAAGNRQLIYAPAGRPGRPSSSIKAGAFFTFQWISHVQCVRGGSQAVIDFMLVAVCSVESAPIPFTYDGMSIWIYVLISCVWIPSGVRTRIQ